jgi:hypothetical protein
VGEWVLEMYRLRVNSIAQGSHSVTSHVTMWKLLFLLG